MASHTHVILKSHSHPHSRSHSHSHSHSHSRSKRKLTEDQRVRMEENRLACLARMRQKQAEKADAKRRVTPTKKRKRKKQAEKADAKRRVVQMKQRARMEKNRQACLERKRQKQAEKAAVKRRVVQMNQRARMEKNRQACHERKRQKQAEKTAVKRRNIIGELRVPLSQVEAVKRTISYMQALESKQQCISKVAVVTPVLLVKRQPRTPDLHRKRRLLCTGKKQTEKAAVEAQTKDQRIPVCSVDLTGEWCVPPSQVDAVKQTISYMETLESKQQHMAKVQPCTPARQVTVGAKLLGLKREYALRRLLLKRRDRKLKSHKLLDIR